MAIELHPKHSRRIPALTAMPVRGHSLTPRFGFVMNQGWADLVRGAPVVSAGTTHGIWSPSANPGYAGLVREHTATSDFDRILLDAPLLFPTSNCSIVIGQQKVDATNRNAVTFGAEVTTDPLFVAHCYIPFSDGIVYWDWGGQSGGNRLTVGGLTHGDDIWVFTTGPRGMEIWQNGILRASNATNAVKSQWAVGTEKITWGKKAGGPLSDLVKYKFTFIYWHQLSLSDINRITQTPFAWVDEMYTLGDPITPFFGGINIDLKQGLPYEAREAGIVLKQGLPYEALGVLSRLHPLPYEAKGRVFTSIPLPYEALGEDPNAITAVFDIFSPVASPITAFFDIIDAIPDTNGIEAQFDIFDGSNGLVVSFDIVDGALVVAQSEDVQMPTAEVEIT